MEQSNQELYNELYLLAKTLLIHDTEHDKLEKHLLQKTDDLVLITVAIKEAKNDHYAILRKEGFRLVAIGAVLVFLGFLITFLNFNSNRSFTLAMYGFTSIGAIVVFFGLYKIIG